MSWSDYWRDGYDWRTQEARLNSFSHFRTRIDDQSIHFLHARSAHAEALPLLITHGWPGSIVEFLDVIPRLTDPESFGGQASDAFHVVAPSLPGYGWSEPPRTPGWDEHRIAGAFIDLMGRLGYSRYGAQGGDWGAQVTTRIGALDPEHCAAVHLNMALGVRPEVDAPLTDGEQADLKAMRRFVTEESGYANEQGTKPQTIGVALNDSPAGLLAWIVEKFRAWSDCDGRPGELLHPRSDDHQRDGVLGHTDERIVGAPVLGEPAKRDRGRARPVRRCSDRRGPLCRGDAALAAILGRAPSTTWSTGPSMERGGHFAAMEQPDLFVEDLRTFFRARALTGGTSRSGGLGLHPRKHLETDLDLVPADR